VLARSAKRLARISALRADTASVTTFTNAKLGTDDTARLDAAAVNAVACIESLGT
jgi:hypothetical protein